MKVVVVGGSGRIGTFVVRELLANTDHEVRVFDRVPSSVPGVRTMRGETVDFGEVLGALDGADAVIHLAAITQPGLAPDHVVFRNNLLGTYNVLDAAHRTGIRRVACASSGAINGWTYAQRFFLPQYLPVDEHHPNFPHDPYGLSKLCEEEVGRSFSFKGDVETVHLRPARVLFPADRKQLYEDGGIHPTAFNLCAYSDVRDLAIAFRLALVAPGITHEAMFVVNDDSLCTEPLSEILPRVTPGLGDLASALTGMKSAVSNERAKRLLDWEPRYTWRVPED